MTALQDIKIPMKMEEVSKEWMRACLRIVKACPDLEVRVMDVGPTGEKLGFMTDHLRAHVEYETQGETKILDLFIKLVPQEPMFRDIMSDIRFDLGEIGFYNSVLEDLKDFLNSRGLHDLELPVPKPVIAYGRSDSPESILVLEDLAVLGYETPDFGKDWDFDHLKNGALILATLAGVSCSYIQVNDIDVSKKYPFMKPKSVGLERAEMTLKDSVQTLFGHLAKFPAGEDEVRGKDEEVRGIVEGFIQKGVEIMATFTTPPKKWKVCSIAQRDTWNNNFLFEYAEDGKVISGRLCDWQFPGAFLHVTDLASLLYSSTSLRMRRDRGPEILRIYYDRLLKVTKDCGLELEYTWAEMLQDWDECLEFAFLHLLLLCVAMTRSDRAEDGHAVLRRYVDAVRELALSGLV